MNKKELYEAIMNSVSKELKNIIDLRQSDLNNNSNISEYVKELLNSNDIQTQQDLLQKCESSRKIFECESYNKLLKILNICLQNNKKSINWLDADNIVELIVANSRSNTRYERISLYDYTPNDKVLFIKFNNVNQQYNKKEKYYSNNDSNRDITFCIKPEYFLNTFDIDELKMPWDPSPAYHGYVIGCNDYRIRDGHNAYGDAVCSSHVEAIRNFNGIENTYNYWGYKQAIRNDTISINKYVVKNGLTALNYCINEVDNPFSPALVKCFLPAVGQMLFIKKNIKLIYAILQFIGYKEENLNKNIPNYCWWTSTEQDNYNAWVVYGQDIRVQQKNYEHYVMPVFDIW